MASLTTTRPRLRKRELSRAAAALNVPLAPGFAASVGVFGQPAIDTLHAVGVKAGWGVHWAPPTGHKVGYFPLWARTFLDRYPPPKASFADLIITAAERDLGVTEHPPGSNSGPRVDEMLAVTGLGPDWPWCAAALSTWARSAGYHGPVSAGVAEWESWARSGTGGLSAVNVANMRPGDGVAYGHGAHIELCVAHARGSSVFVTIGGNTSASDGSFSNGGVVARNTRTDGGVSTVIRFPG